MNQILGWRAGFFCGSQPKHICSHLGFIEEDSCHDLTDDLIKVGNQLKTVQGSYDTSMKKLTGKGNLVTKVEKIKQLGAKTSKIMNKNLLDRANED